MIDIGYFQTIKKRCGFEADFMFVDRDPPKNKVIVQSPGVLGNLFRDIKDNIDKEDLLKIEYELKINKWYPLDNKFYKHKEICPHLPFIYSKVVKPYNEEIRWLMRDRNMASEGDIFNSTCEFLNSASTRDESYQFHQDLRLIINSIKEKYISILKDYQEVKFEVKKKSDSPKANKRFVLCETLNLALKFATYYHQYHFRNRSLGRFRKIKSFMDFAKMVKKDSRYYPMTYADFKRIVSSSFAEENELSAVISQVQLFSAWWLLSG